MAVRTWQISAPRPAFRYHSLALVAAAIGRPDVTVIADARRERWHACSIGSSLRRVSSAELNGPTIAPEGFRAWMPLPPNAERAPYSLAGMLTKVEEQDLFQPADEPDAFLHEEPNYATWTRQIHRAPFAL
jgi:tRNA threonylcarbamoyladenosine biosynthesis protein TsaB